MIKTFLQLCVCRARIFCALAAALAFAPGLLAQESARFDNRVLFILDTSWSMKARASKTQVALTQLTARLAVENQLRDGDTIGVWTFAKTATVGKFPLQTWNANSAATIVSNINNFVLQQRYGGKTSFDSLMQWIPNVVQDSDRLTLVFFCDGDGKISGTPYDDQINNLFQQRHAAARSDGQPFVVILRTQLGHYVGGSVNVAPESEIPTFPPLPAPPQPAPAAPPTNATPLATPTEHPLIIIGTNVYDDARALSNLPPQSKIEKSNSPVAPTVSVAITNLVTNSPPMQQTNVQVVPTNVVAETRTTPPPPVNSDSRKLFAIVGIGFFIAASGLIFFLWQRSRKGGSSSLITRSMNKK